jgi:hypothetical protein
MAQDSKRILVSELDFDQIKANLKTYLRGQPEFTDYDFEGSGLSVLLDVLAYNTHYNALYQNFTVNEMFLDSAGKRNSVVSRAKELGYTPYSATCSEAIIDLTITSPTSFPSSLTLPKNASFITTVDGETYTFYTTDAITIPYTAGYKFTDVTIKEGTPVTFKYTVASGARYMVPNSNVDMKTLVVRVQESSQSTVFHTYTRADSILNVSGSDRAYFVKEIENQLYELKFGDGLLGMELSNGNVVHMDYFVTNAASTNGAKQFTYTGPTLLNGGTTITLKSAAYKGADIESIASIKFNAPKAYTAQNRAVTADDYQSLIYNNFPAAQSVAVWGGEDNVPPVYGKTFICVKPQGADTLSAVQKSEIIDDILGSRNVVSITPEIIDPEYINIALTTTVYFNDRETTRSPSEISSLVSSTILNYNDNDLQKFDGVFRFSKLSRLIDNTEPAIVNNISTIVLHVTLAPRFNTYAEYIVNIINPIYTEHVAENAVSSHGFYIPNSTEIHYLQDDGVGNIQLFRHNNSELGQQAGATANHIVVNPTIGTVDYATGYIKIQNLNITALAESEFHIIIKPQSNDVVSAFHQIARIEPSRMTITAIPDTTSNGDLRAGQNYVFTSSRS